MTRGPRPKIVAGSSPVADIGKAPAWLSPDAKSEWKRVSAVLNERHTITEADIGTLESYVTSVGVVREAQRLINKEGLIINGKRHPAFGIMNAAQTTARLCATELGLTPVSRSRPSIRDNNPDDDDDSPLNLS